MLPPAYRDIAEAYAASPLAMQGLFEAGRIWRQQGEHARARRSLEALVKRYPQASMRYEAWLLLGQSRLDLKAYAEALDAFAEAAQAPDKKLAAQAVWYSGRAHSAAGDLQQGINAYLRLVYLYPDATTLVPQALREAARNYVALRKCSEALKVYDKIPATRRPGQAKTVNGARTCQGAGAGRRLVSIARWKQKGWKG